jgi:flagellar biosynthesis protein FliQ
LGALCSDWLRRNRDASEACAHWGKRVGADQALYLLNQLVWSALIIGAPIMATTLVVGLIISVIQVATQIQEITLSYVPKLLATAIVLLLLGGWMLGKLTQFAMTLYQSIPNLVD